MTETYAKRPLQTDRFGQVTQKPLSMDVAPSAAADSFADRLSGTTLPAGETIPEMRLNLAEQAAGEGGKSSKRQAPSNTSAADASGKLCIAAVSDMSSPRHTAAQSPGESNLSLPVMVNIHTPKLNAFSLWGGHFNWWPILNFAGCLALWACIIATALYGVSFIAEVTS